MPVFLSKPYPITAEQFDSSADPETWHPAVKWGGDLPAGLGQYVVKVQDGTLFPLENGDWIRTDEDGAVLNTYSNSFLTAFYELYDPILHGQL